MEASTESGGIKFCRIRTLGRDGILSGTIYTIRRNLEHHVGLSEAQHYHSGEFRSPERKSEWIISIYYYNKTLNALRLYGKTHIKMMNE